MKKQLLFLFAIVACSFTPAMAQKGTWLWYGNLGGSNASAQTGIVNGVKWQINTVQGIGYQVGHHWHVGVQGSLGFVNSEAYNTFGGVDHLKNSDWSAGLFVRYTVGHKVYAYAQYDMGYAYSKQKVNDHEIGHSTGLGIGITPTVGVNVYRGWCLNLSFANINYNSTNPTSSTGNAVNTTNLVYNVFQTFTFSVSKIFGGHCVPEGVVKWHKKNEGPEPAEKK